MDPFAAPTATPATSAVSKGKRNSKPRAEWSVEKEDCFLRSLVQSVELGLKGQNGFKQHAWTDCKDAIDAEMPSSSWKVEIMQLKNKYEWFRRYWRTWEAIGRLSGFGPPEEEGGTYTADEDVWDNYIQVSICCMATMGITTDIVRSTQKRRHSIKGLASLTIGCDF